MAAVLRVLTDAKGRVTGLADAQGAPLAYVVVRDATDRPSLGAVSTRNSESEMAPRPTPAPAPAPAAALANLVPPPQQQPLSCAHCKTADASVYCGSCTTPSRRAVYCSADCARLAWAAGHYEKCKGRR